PDVVAARLAGQVAGDLVARGKFDLELRGRELLNHHSLDRNHVALRHAVSRLLKSARPNEKPGPRARLSAPRGRKDGIDGEAAPAGQSHRTAGTGTARRGEYGWMIPYRASSVKRCP